MQRVGARFFLRFGVSVTALTAGAGVARAADVSATNGADQVSQVQEVVVTGSRIQNPGMTSPTPLTVLGGQQLQQLAPSTADDILNNLPTFRPSAGPNQATRNSGSISTGQSLADLRGLGPQRTLVLIDGQRPVPTNALGTTSTAIIPVGLIKRVDVVTGGASAAYGSDAVAGVTNFVLDDRLKTLRASVYGGVSQRGDNQEFGVSFADGLSLMGDRLHLAGGLDFNKNWGVGNIYSRDWSAVEPGNSGTPIAFGAARSAGTAAFGWANGVEYAAQTPGGVINAAKTASGASSTLLNQLAFNPDGSTSTLVRGPVYGNLMINSSSNHIATPIAQWDLKEPITQFSSMGRATYDFDKGITGWVQTGFAWSHVFAVSQFHQTPTDTILVSNPYLPAALKAYMTANNIAQFDMGRVDTEWLGTTGDNDNFTFQISTGLKGRVFDRFNWDVSYAFGRSTIDSHVYGTKEANLAAAEYAVVDGGGNIVCGPIASNPNFAAGRLTNTIQVANVQAGCAPLDPFGVGHVSAAAKAYVSGIEFTKDTMVRHDVSANLNGPLFQLPAGPVSVATGFEYRYDSLVQFADAAQVQGLYSSGNNRSYSGSNDVKEGYAEIEIPLVADAIAVKQLGLNAAVRRTDYATSGAVTTWKVGGIYEPISGLRFRITRSHDIRAPSLSELFSVGGVSSTGSFFNPFTGQSARLPVQTTGNSTLVPEKADTLTTGFTLQSPWGLLPGFHFSFDYYRIKVHDVIASVAANDVLTRCYQGITSYCSAITFDNSVFGIAKINVQPFNQSLLDEEGFDIEAGYHANLSRFGLPGAIDIQGFATHMAHLRSTDRAGPQGVTLDYAGYQNGAPKWVVSTFINYHLAPVTVGLEARGFTAIGYSPSYVGPGQAGYSPTLSNSISKNIFPGLIYWNLNGAYDLKLAGRPAQLFLKVNNLFDKDPPAYAIAAINLGGNPYDYVGRTFKFGVRMGF